MLMQENKSWWFLWESNVWDFIILLQMPISKKLDWNNQKLLQKI